MESNQAHRLKPGHHLLVDQEGSQLVEYWDLVYPPSSELGDSG